MKYLSYFYLESGIGAGIDSYYEYLLKGYVLLGEEKYLTRFNKVCPTCFLVFNNLNNLSVQMNRWEQH